MFFSVPAGKEPLDAAALRYAGSAHEVRMRIEFARPGTFSDIDPADLAIQDL